MMRGGPSRDHPAFVTQLDDEVAGATQDPQSRDGSSTLARTFEYQPPARRGQSVARRLTAAVIAARLGDRSVLRVGHGVGVGGDDADAFRAKAYSDAL